MPRRKSRRPNLFDGDKAPATSADLREEIDMLRRMIRRVMEETDGNLELVDGGRTAVRS